MNGSEQIAANEANATRIAVVAAMAATLMLFASLASAYLVRRSFADWQAGAAWWPPVLLALGVGASWAIEVASRSDDPARRQALGGLVATSLLYLASAITVIATTLRGDEGLERPHDAFVALLLGVHVIHAILGGAFAARALRPADRVLSGDGIFLARLLTHFLTALLAGVLFLLFVLR
jgi:heme/copper-type cytochrome/quinol oxidase subunit 3